MFVAVRKNRLIPMPPLSLQSFEAALSRFLVHNQDSAGNFCWHNSLVLKEDESQAGRLWHLRSPNSSSGGVWKKHARQPGVRRIPTKRALHPGACPPPLTRPLPAPTSPPPHYPPPLPHPPTPPPHPHPHPPPPSRFQVSALRRRVAKSLKAPHATLRLVHQGDTLQALGGGFSAPAPSPSPMLPPVAEMNIFDFRRWF